MSLGGDATDILTTELDVPICPNSKWWVVQRGNCSGFFLYYRTTMENWINILNNGIWESACCSDFIIRRAGSSETMRLYDEIHAANSTEGDYIGVFEISGRRSNYGIGMGFYDIPVAVKKSCHLRYIFQVEDGFSFSSLLPNFRDGREQVPCKLTDAQIRDRRLTRELRRLSDEGYVVERSDPHDGDVVLVNISGTNGFVQLLIGPKYPFDEVWIVNRFGLKKLAPFKHNLIRKVLDDCSWRSAKLPMWSVEQIKKYKPMVKKGY